MSELSELFKAMNFESTAHTVFERLINGNGPGLLVLWGGSPGEAIKANKTYFLNMVETFQKGAKPAKPHASDYLWDLLKQLEPDHYQCVRVKEDSNLSDYALYQTPLSVAISLALAGAVNRRGLTVARNIVILCDDIHEFMRRPHLQANEEFLRELASSLDKQTVVTFLGASRLTWNAKAIVGQERALALGWD